MMNSFNAGKQNQYLQNKDSDISNKLNQSRITFYHNLDPTSLSAFLSRQLSKNTNQGNLIESLKE